MEVLNQPTPHDRRLSQKLTRIGFHSVFVGAFAMLGGALRGFNLLLVLAALMVGALIMQWRWSRRSLERITARRTLPSEFIAGRKTSIRYQIHNLSGWIPAWMLRIEDPIQSDNSSGRDTISTGVPLIEPKSSRVSSLDIRFSNRGRYRLSGVRVMTGFPFSLSTSILSVTQPEEIVVYPELYQLKRNWRKRLTHQGAGSSMHRRRQGQAEGEFYGLRGWKNGDSLRWIHWRTSARIGELAVRQFEHQRRLDICIVLDAWIEADENARNDSNHVESAVSLAATLTNEIVTGSNDQVALVCIAETSAIIPGSRGGDHIARRMLESLADAKASSNPDWESALQQCEGQGVRAKQMVVISSRTHSDFKKAHTAEAKKIEDWSRRGTLQWLDVRTDLSLWKQDPPKSFVERSSSSSSEVSHAE
ncbi:MAG: DUF58 domain-containing protein [Rubripirellula sp.]|nr:DUF58 domain-containing protein [Rubripirellula sp.]